jgi:hypothetical protein
MDLRYSSLGQAILRGDPLPEPLQPVAPQLRAALERV